MRYSYYKDNILSIFVINKVLTTMLILLCCQYGTAQHGTDLKDYFKARGVEGSTTIYDYKNKRWIFTDSLDADRATLPASTFKILNSLIGLDRRVIKNEKDVMKWDGTDHQLFGKSYPIWNRDTDLQDAFKNSTIWFYVNLAERLGRGSYKKIINKLDYGNGDFSEKGTDFWNYGAFAVTPKQQINFLIRLYEDRLPFSVQTTGVVKQIMLSDSTAVGVWRDKTGWAQQAGQDIGWWVGYVTTAENVFFFATRITKDIDNPMLDFASSRKTITKQIIAELMK